MPNPATNPDPILSEQQASEYTNTPEKTLANLRSPKTTVPKTWRSIPSSSCMRMEPAGWQMAVSTARTAQAIRDTQFPDLDITVHSIALTKDHCIDWDLPSTPLKETEKRGDRWRTAMGREQTELDAAVALAPKEFAKVVDDSLLQYFDYTLARRSLEINERLTDEANERLAEQLGEDALVIRPSSTASTR